MFVTKSSEKPST